MKSLYEISYRSNKTIKLSIFTYYESLSTETIISNNIYDRYITFRYLLHSLSVDNSIYNPLYKYLLSKYKELHFYFPNTKVKLYKNRKDKLHTKKYTVRNKKLSLKYYKTQ